MRIKRRLVLTMKIPPFIKKSFYGETKYGKGDKKDVTIKTYFLLYYDDISMAVGSMPILVTACETGARRESAHVNFLNPFG